MKRFLAVLVILFAALLNSCSERTPAAYPQDITRAFAEARLPLLSQTVTPPDFTLALALGDGESLALSDLRGKVVFLNFWATWCGPCRYEMPSMEALYNRLKDRGLEIVAVNCMEGEPLVSRFMRDYNLSFPAVLDLDGSVSTIYGINAIPTTFLLNRDGDVVLRLVGSIDWDTPEIHRAIEALLDQ